MNHLSSKKEKNKSISPSNSLSVSNSTSINKRNAKSKVKNEIKRMNKVIEDFSSTKYLNEFIYERHSKDKTPKRKKSEENKKEKVFTNNRGLNNNFNKNKKNILDGDILKVKPKIVNGRNIAMIRQKTSKEFNNNSMAKIKIPTINFEKTQAVRGKSKSKTPKKEKEIIFDNKSISEKTYEIGNIENKLNYNLQDSNNIAYYSNDNNNITMISNLNNKIISNNSITASNISNLNSSYENSNIPYRNYPYNNFYANNIHQNDHLQGNNYNTSFLNSNTSNLFPSNSNNNQNFDSNKYSYAKN